MQNITQKIIRLVIALLIFALPLLFVSYFFDTVDFSKELLLVAATLLSLLLYSIFVINNGQIEIRYTKSFLLSSVLVGVALITTIFSTNTSTSLFGLGSNRSWSLAVLVALWLLYFLVIQVFGREDIKNIKNILILSLTVVFVFGILRLFGLFGNYFDLFIGRAFNTVGSPNALGILTGITLPLFLAMSGTGYIWRIIQSIGFIVGVAILVILNWLPIWLVAFAGLFIILILRPHKSGENSKVISILAPALVIIVGLTMILLPININSVKNLLPVEISPSYKLSFEVARQALFERPQGFGPEMFPIAFDLFRPKTLANSVFYNIRFIDAASEAFNAVIQMGVLAILVIIASVSMVARRFWSVRERLATGDHTFLWASLWAFIVAFAVYPIQITSLFVGFMVFVLIDISEHKVRTRALNFEKNVHSSIFNSIAFIGSIVLVILSSYFFVKQGQANILLKRAVSSSDQKIRLDYSRRAIIENPRDIRSYHVAINALNQSIADRIRNGPEKGETPEAFRTNIQEMAKLLFAGGQELIVRDPNDAQNWLKRAESLAGIIGYSNGIEEGALAAFQEALKRNPNNPEVYDNIGAIYLRLAEIARQYIAGEKNSQKRQEAEQQRLTYLKNAQENFEKAIAIYPNYGRSIYNLGLVYERQGKLKESIKQFENILRGNKKEPGLFFQIGLLYYRDGRKNDAIAALRRSVELFPKYANAHWYLSLFFEEAEDLDAALEQVKLVEETNPDNELVKARLEKLEAGILTKPVNAINQKPLP